MINKYNKVRVIDIDNNIVEMQINAGMNNEEIRYSIKNIDTKDLYIKEVIIDNGDFDNCSDNAMLFCEGYEMLSQYYKKLVDISPDDGTMSKGHYKMPQTSGYVVGYNYMYLEDDNKCKLYGATSCNSYSVEFRFNRGKFEVAQILEGRKVSPNEEIKLEGYCILDGADRNAVLERLSVIIVNSHKMRAYSEVPDGWCSWYCYGPRVTEESIFKNLNSAKELGVKGMKYIQIDDGYQPHMGDWLLQTDKFKTDMKDICMRIRQEGFEPAMWVAPFIASEGSSLFHNHADWFIKNIKGEPLCAADCTYRGWRDAPWYFLDLTNADAKKYIQDVFRIMKYEWGVNYFKLDANAWGGLPFGIRANSSITSVEAYRLGMEAIWDAVGEDTFLLGCNAPMFPSLGVVSGMRVTTDIYRSTNCVKALAQQGFYRNWMNGKLWINDPDCLIQEDLVQFIRKPKHKRRRKNQSMYRYNAAYIRASGGMVLSGDKLFDLNNYDLRIIEELISTPRISALFNYDYSVGVIDNGITVEYLLFNDSKRSREYNISIKKGKLTDVFANFEVSNEGRISVKLRPNDAAWFKLSIK